MTQSITQWLKVNKEGMIIGALVGLAYTIYLASTGADLNYIVAAHKTGFVDQIIGTSSCITETATTKVGLMFIFIGAFMGGMIDMMINPKK